MVVMVTTFCWFPSNGVDQEGRWDGAIQQSTRDRIPTKKALSNPNPNG